MNTRSVRLRGGLAIGGGALLGFHAEGPLTIAGGALVAELEALAVEADLPARVVVNERTGTIVMGKDVKISPVSIIHGSLSLQVGVVFGVYPHLDLDLAALFYVPHTHVLRAEGEPWVGLVRNAARVLIGLIAAPAGLAVVGKLILLVTLTAPDSFQSPLGRLPGRLTMERPGTPTRRRRADPASP